ncbi:MAG: hypothetical protein Q4G25_15730 [Paracoccus sp. (in: a-proteobacteria)]|nr:hypothetical protein [Paracoccus sp. (in: a-proteobacteria)]
MNRFAAALWAFAALPLPLSANICAEGMVLEYPISAVIAAEGRAVLDFDLAGFEATMVANAIRYGGSDQEIADIRADFNEVYDKKDARRAFLADEPQPRRDAMLLSALDQGLADDISPLLYFTTRVHPDLVTAYQEALDRQGLAGIADLTRRAMGMFGDQPDHVARHLSLLEGDGFLINPLAKRAFALLEQQLAPQRHLIAERAEALFMTDPALRAEIETKHHEADARTRLDWAVKEIRPCITDWDGKLRWDQPEYGENGWVQHDLAWLDQVLQKVAMPGGNLELLFRDPAGGVIWEITDLLEYLGLDEHAAALDQAMALFPDDTALFSGTHWQGVSARSQAMDAFDDARMARLAELSEVFKDGAVERAMIELAISSGFMPELADAPP